MQGCALQSSSQFQPCWSATTNRGQLLFEGGFINLGATPLGDIDMMGLFFNTNLEIDDQPRQGRFYHAN